MSAATATALTTALADAAARVRLLVLDVDGVLTDGRLYYGARGEALKVFHVHDGLGLKLLGKAGITVAVISGRRSAMTGRRCRELGVKHLVQGAQNKLAAFQRLRARLGMASSACACVGDDLPDVPLMREVGLSFAVADAHPQARRAAQVVTELSGGNGAVREICDFLLEAHRRAGAAP
ncbi:MAG: HAD-IIIA family hydrolase [Steroidobacteraceae bacterium]